MRQLLEQLGRPALGDPRPAVDDEVLQQAGWLQLRALDRERHPRVLAEVAELLLLTQMSGDDLVAVESDPHAGDLRGAVAIQRDQVG